MDNKIKIDVRVFLMMIAIIIWQLFPMPKEIKNTTKVVKTTTETIKKEVDSVKVDLLLKNEPNNKVDYLVDTLTNKARVYNPKKSASKKPSEKKVKAIVHKGSVQLKNAKVVYKIASPEKILGLDFKVFTDTKTITHNIDKETTRYVIPNQWFVNYESKVSILPVPTIVGHEIGVDYTIKGKLRLGAGIEYNSLLPAGNKVIGNLKIGIRL